MRQVGHALREKKTLLGKLVSTIILSLTVKHCSGEFQLIQNDYEVSVHSGNLI